MIKDKLFGIIVFLLFGFIGVSGFCCIYKVLSWFYTELSVNFNNIFIEVPLLIIPVIFSMILSGIFAYIFDIGLKVFICCFDKKGEKYEKSI